MPIFETLEELYFDLKLLVEEREILQERVMFLEVEIQNKTALLLAQSKVSKAIDFMMF